MKWLLSQIKSIEEILLFIFTNKNDSISVPELTQPTSAPQTPPITQNTPKQGQFHPNIITWARTIQIREGGQPDNQNIRLNNPGNLRCATLTTSFKGFKNCTTNNFCYYSTYQDGFNALCSFLTLACEGQLKPYPKGTTIRQFTRIYAQPPNDEYALAVASALHISPDSPIDLIIS